MRNNIVAPNRRHSYKSVLQLSCQLAMAFLFFILAGCSKRYSDLPAYFPFGLEERDNQSVGRFKTAYLAEQIDDYFRGTDPGPIAVTTFVQADDLYNTSTFGRVVSEMLMSELAMRGYNVIELRASDAVQFRPTAGEFALSRDINEIKRERKLGALVVGTYVASPDRVYVNARLLEPSTSAILSAASVEMSKSDEIKRLLRGGSVMPVMERIPVKHLGLSRYPMNSFKQEGGSESDLISEPAQPMLGVK